VLTISNVVENGKPIGELGDAEAAWHQDMTYNESPPVGAFLYAIELPPRGGDTSFCNLYRAYETLEPSLQQQVQSLACIHDITLDSAGRPRKGYTPTTDPRQAQGALHPLVLEHPRTRRRHLYLGRRKWAYVPGLSLEDSEALLDAIWAHCARAEFHWTQNWQLGDLILWDNRCTMHRRDAFPADSRRVLHRTQLRNDEAPAAQH
jgi:taurine dioxygenase